MLYLLNMQKYFANSTCSYDSYSLMLDYPDIALPFVVDSGFVDALLATSLSFLEIGVHP